MTSGGKMARRSARVFAEEYQPTQENTSRDRAGSHISAVRDQDEKHLETSPSRGSSCSSLSLVTFDMDTNAETVSNDSSRDVTPGLDSTRVPKDKIKGHPVNFGTVMPGFYRSGYPQTEDYEYLKSLGLKTIVTLVQKDYPEGYQLFMETNGIRHIVIDLQGTKKVNISLAVMNSIIEVALNRRNYPLLMHCNQGKHRTGCVVAVIRKTMGWRLDAVIEEYTEYAFPKSRETDLKYIRGFEVQSLLQVSQESVAGTTFSPAPSGAMSQARMVKMVAMAALMLGLWVLATVQIRP